MVRVNLIVKYKGASEWKSAGEYELATLPRVSEHIAIQPDTLMCYQIVSIVHVVPTTGLIEVFAAYDGTIMEVQKRLFEVVHSVT